MQRRNRGRLPTPDIASSDPVERIARTTLLVCQSETGLLLLVAGSRFWSMAMDARNRAALNGDYAPIRPGIISRVGPQKPEPFKDVDLTPEQRRQIDAILKSQPQLPPPGSGGQSQPHFVKILFK